MTANRTTDVGLLAAQGDVAEARARVAEALEATGGNVRRAAWLLDTSRMNLYRWIARFGLASLVLDARARRATKIREADRALRARLAPMDEQLSELVDACAGATPEQIHEALEASALASELGDVQLVAEYLAHLAGG